MNEKECIVCKKNEQEVPIIQFDFMGKKYAICPQHLPLLIHDPSKLKGFLPDAEKLDAYQG
jgi:hypothetical protein